MTTKDRISHATIALSYELGINGAATAKIAHKAGIAIGTLFHHFPSKKKLVVTIFLEIYKDYIGWIKNKLAETGGGLKKQIKVIIRESVKYWLAEPLKFDFLYQVYNSKYYDEVIHSEIILLRSDMEEIIQTGVERKILRSADPKILSQMIFNSILTNSQMVISANDDSEQTRYRKEGQRFLWNAIKMTNKPK